MNLARDQEEASDRGRKLRDETGVMVATASIDTWTRGDNYPGYVVPANLRMFDTMYAAQQCAAHTWHSHATGQ